MRFLKDELLFTKEIVCDSTNILESLSQNSYGSDIYQISTEQYDKLKAIDGIELSRAIRSSKSSEYQNKKIGLFNKDLVGSPLVLFNKQDNLKTRSFSFIFQNKIAGIENNECEVIDNYPDICNTRDIAKYHTDYHYTPTLL